MREIIEPHEDCLVVERVQVYEDMERETIRLDISRGFFMGKPTGWEVDLKINDLVVMSGSSPTMYGATDMAFEYLQDHMRDWVSHDANQA